jgi:4-hydroxy-tetrahydrodipicolinate reductase
MGTAVTRLVAASSDCTLTGAAAEPGDPMLGQDAGTVASAPRLNVVISDTAAAAVAHCDVAIDFTAAAAAEANIAACLQRGCALVMGTTGLGEAQMAALERASQRIAVVYGRNMSVGVLVFTELVGRAARLLGPEADVEIVEAHHRKKPDAPSGTALQLGEAVARELGHRLDDVAVYDRFASRTPRRQGSIGFSSIRAGSIVGDHEVLFAMDEEVIELRHRALDRATFARGAVRAARWVMGRPPALYSMGDVLGLSQSH